jgi:hypothetical protein
LKVEVADWGENVSQDISDGNFSIVDIIAPTVSVSQPGEGFSIPEYDSLSVIWSAVDNILLDSLFVYYRNNSADEYALQGAVLSQESQFTFVVPAGVTEEAPVEVKARDHAGNCCNGQYPANSNC